MPGIADDDALRTGDPPDECIRYLQEQGQVVISGDNQYRSTQHCDAIERGVRHAPGLWLGVKKVAT